MLARVLVAGGASALVLDLVLAAGVVVGTLKDGYVRNVPLPRIPRIQSASHATSHELITPIRCIQAGTPLPDYLQISSWIPTPPKLGSLLGFSQRILWPFSPIAIKAKNNLLS